MDEFVAHYTTQPELYEEKSSFSIPDRSAAETYKIKFAAQFESGSLDWKMWAGLLPSLMNWAKANKQQRNRDFQIKAERDLSQLYRTYLWVQARDEVFMFIVNRLASDITNNFLCTTYYICRGPTPICYEHNAMVLLIACTETDSVFKSELRHCSKSTKAVMGVICNAQNTKFKYIYGRWNYSIGSTYITFYFL